MYNNNLSQTHLSFLRLKTVAYIHEGSSKPSLAEIHQEMSELLDKHMNAQKESLKNTPGVPASFQKPMKKCVMKMKVERKK